MTGRTILLVLLAAAPAAVPADTGIEAGTILWDADNGQNRTLLWGPVLRLQPPVFGRPPAFRASYLQGTYNQGGDRERHREGRITAGWSSDWGVFAGGWNYLQIDTTLQRHFVWSYPEEEEERNADLHGPLLAYEGAWSLFRELHAVVSGGWMPYDAGDLDELGYDGSFYEVAGGLEWTTPRTRLAAGYRYRRYRDVPDRVINDQSFDRSTQDGWYLDLVFRF